MRSNRCLFLALLILATSAARPAHAYIEAPMTLGAVLKASATIVHFRVEKVDKEKKLIYLRKVQDLKGKYPDEVMKQMVGEGHHPREPKFVLDWAEPGQSVVWFSNGSASVTCTGTYWYDGYPLGNWWRMQSGQPYLQRTYCGPVERLAEAVKDLMDGKEVIIPAVSAECSKLDIHIRKGPVQPMKASLKLLEYDAKRDLVPEEKK